MSPLLGWFRPEGGAWCWLLEKSVAKACEARGNCLVNSVGTPLRIGGTLGQLRGVVGLVGVAGAEG